ncbi:adenylate cyclase [Constrictibacter sp. MBR-5]|jgi:class 3 adenylate cyclase|uniref:adenylate/guanylate cyclase domain-containing protein n=1 Tax=Constrictibacter sp. MBR-5 TaxID=3156467 RepID=UPI0033926983
MADDAGCASTPTDSAVLARLLQGLGTGVAVVDADWRVTFENAKFFQWFPPSPADPGTLQDRLPGFDAAMAAERIRAGRSLALEVETRNARPVPVVADIRALPQDGEGRMLVECRDISKQKQAEYMLESYSHMSEKHTRELQREKDRVEKLLLNIMPRSVYEEMKDYGTVTPQRFDHASILMLDFVGFTEMAISREPAAMITELNDIFTAFDRIVELFGCERIKTIGDAYMAVSGLPEASLEHAHNVARAALRMKRYIERRNDAHPETWHCRIGVGTGPVVGSIVGIQKYVYDIFGPGVNLASRIEAVCEPMQILCCAATHALIANDFDCRAQAEVDLKGFGASTLYSIERELARSR